MTAPGSTNCVSSRTRWRRRCRKHGKWCPAYRWHQHILSPNLVCITSRELMAHNRWFGVFCRLCFCTVHYLRMSRRCLLVWVRELKMRSSNWCVSLCLSQLCFTPKLAPFSSISCISLSLDKMWLPMPLPPTIALILSCSFTKLCQGRSCYSHSELCFVCERDAGIHFSPSLLRCPFPPSSSSLFSIRFPYEPGPSVVSVICVL